MAKKLKTDKFYDHEAMDRSWMLMENVGEWICEHPAVKIRPKARKLAIKAHKALFELYQMLGTEID